MIMKVAKEPEPPSPMGFSWTVNSAALLGGSIVLWLSAEITTLGSSSFSLSGLIRKCGTGEGWFRKVEFNKRNSKME